MTAHSDILIRQLHATAPRPSPRESNRIMVERESRFIINHRSDSSHGRPIVYDTLNSYHWATPNESGSIIKHVRTAQTCASLPICTM